MIVSVIGAGLAGCECAWRLAEHGIDVTLYEQKPVRYSPAHTSPDFAELVCSNSLKASRLESAGGLLKEEMRLFGSLVLDTATYTKVEAGGALAVDRHAFARTMTLRVSEHPRITIVREEVRELPDGIVVIATGPLTSDALTDTIARLTGERNLSFYDAAAPIVETASVDMDHAFAQARYGRGGDDYVNCPLSQAEYEAFIDALLTAERAPLKEFEREYFRVYEGCMPVEVLASRGRESLRFGPMRPVGLIDPRTGRRPWAVVQLRNEDSEGCLMNLVGFQTNLTFPEQRRVFGLIPALRGATYARYGVMHRNSFIHAPTLLGPDLSLKSDDRVLFAGQITGVEGYVESAMTGIVVAEQLIRRAQGRGMLALLPETMMGALIAHVTQSTSGDYQPMGANMGLLPPLPQRFKQKQDKYRALAQRAMDTLRQSLDGGVQ